ncbi:MAG: recombinase family protein [Achromobacter sp.]|nr:recombinase family protein [Achromobacter sp.]
MPVHAGKPLRTEPEPPEAAALRALGCEHVFSDIDDDRRIDRPGLRSALEFARVGDVLVVPALNHLGVDVEAVVRIVASLSRKGVTIQLGHMPMDMMIPTGEALAFACRALAQLSEPAPVPATTSGGPRRRGRPGVLRVRSG